MYPYCKIQPLCLVLSRFDPTHITANCCIKRSTYDNTFMSALQSTVSIVFHNENFVCPSCFSHEATNPLPIWGIIRGKCKQMTSLDCWCRKKRVCRHCNIDSSEKKSRIRAEGSQRLFIRKKIRIVSTTSQWQPSRFDLFNPETKTSTMYDAVCHRPDNERTNKQTKERTNKRIHERTNKRTKEQTNERTN